MVPSLKAPRGSAPPYHRLDSVWMSRVRRSGWQGWTLLAGGDDVMDQSILFWLEGKGASRCLSLTLRIRQGSDRKVRDHLSGLPGLEVYRGSIPYPRKQVVAGEVHPLDREWSLVAGTALDAQVDANVRVRYLPYENASRSDATPYSAQGCLTVVMDGAHGHLDEATSLLVMLIRRLGIEPRLSTAADLEYLYLRKISWAMRLDLDKFDATLDGGDPLPALREFVSQALHVDDVTALAGYDWQPRFNSAYNPWTSAIGTGEAGWPHWERFDVDEALQGPLGTCFLGHDLRSDAPNVADSVARIFRSTGHLLSAEERWLRLGTPSQSIHMAHGQWGGGTYLPLRLQPSSHQATLVFDIGLLRRADHIALNADSGALSPQTLADRLPLSALGPDRPRDIYFKRAISLMDSLVRINLDRPTDRMKVLDTLRLLGIERLGGQPVEDVVRVRESKGDA